MIPSPRLSLLFDPAPAIHGRRGDACLWREMANYLDRAELTGSGFDLRRAISRAFFELTGHRLDARDDFHVTRYDTVEHRGMVTMRFWREQAIPILEARLCTHLERHTLPSS